LPAPKTKDKVYALSFVFLSCSDAKEMSGGASAGTNEKERGVALLVKLIK